MKLVSNISGEPVQNERISAIAEAAEQIVNEQGNEARVWVNGHIGLKGLMYVDTVVHIAQSDERGGGFEVRWIENGNPVLQVDGPDEDGTYKLVRWHGQGYRIEDHILNLVGE